MGNEQHQILARIHCTTRNNASTVATAGLMYVELSIYEVAAAQARKKELQAQNTLLRSVIRKCPVYCTATIVGSGTVLAGVQKETIRRGESKGLLLERNWSNGIK